MAITKARDDDELMVFADDINEHTSVEYREPWKLIIADDEDEVHAVTQMVLEDTVFEDRKIEFLSAFSGEQTIQLITKHPDTAIILLDVVMERDDSGLRVARYIREELNNKLVRIILRTGQPGQAPERKVITEYDINDYKEKTELTAQKLYTTVLASLRSYRDLNIIDRNKKNLETIINNAGSLFEAQSLQSFALNVMRQLKYFILHEDAENGTKYAGIALSYSDDMLIKVLTGIGEFEGSGGFPYEKLDPQVKKVVTEVITKKESLFGRDYYAGFFKSELDTVLIIYFQSIDKPVDLDINLLKVFSTNVLAAYDNIVLNQEIIDTQKEVVLTLGEVVETRSKETAYHVKRVAEISRVLALKYGMSEDDAELIRMASPMHDVGKIGIPDAVLNKPARLTPQEFEIMKRHTTIGYDILKSSNRKILQTASIIALQHHEWWNGGGYPRKISGNEIHIFGRITAIADVFDALLHKRIYKDAWSVDTVLEFIKNSSGIQFDPLLVEIFFKNLDEIMKIIEAFPD